MTWIFYALTAVVFYTFLTLSQRVIATKSKYPRAASFVFNLFASATTLIYLFFTGGLKDITFKASLPAWGTVLIACLFYGLFERNRFIIYKYLDASNATIVSNVSVVIAFVGSLFIYHEHLSLPKLVGALLILIALVVISQNKSKSSHFSTKGLLIGLLIYTFGGLGWMLDKAGATNFNSSTYSLFVWIFPTILVFLPFIKKSEIVTEIKLGGWKILVAAALNAFGYLFQLRALEISEATKVLPILQTSTFFTVILAALLLKEKDHLGRKSICAILAIIGSVLLINA